MNRLINLELKDNIIYLNYEHSKYFVKVINNDLVQVAQIEAIDYKSYAVEKDISIAVDIKIEKNIISFSNKKIIVNDDFLLEMYEDGILVSKDKTNDFCNEREQNELLELEGHSVQDNDHYVFMVRKELNHNDYIYGLGDKTGFLNKRCYEYINWNSDLPQPQVDSFKSLYKSIPFFIVKGDKSYGIFLDNTYKSVFNFGEFRNDSLYFGSTDGLLNYYYFFGDMKKIIGNYTLLTGRCPLPQRRFLGYHQCRWSYFTKEEVLELVDNCEKYNIPLEFVHLDIDYMERYKVFTTSDERFPNIEQMIEDLKAKGIKIICIIDPGVKAEEGYFVYEEGLENGYFATQNGEVYHNAVWPGDSVFPQFTLSSTRKWWGGLTKKLTDIGVAGIWNDMNEPASFNGPLPLDVEFKSDDRMMYHKEVHNIYGHLMAEATYKGIKENTGLRPFVITRACYAGSQKYSTAWTGDNHSIWAHLEMAVPQLSNLGLSGMPFVGTDIGGFGSDTTKELLIRWVQLGIFSPLCRNHSAAGTRRQEPWTFDDETAKIYSKFIHLRYKLIPYIYDLFVEHVKTGLPVNRPLVLNYPNDENTFNLNDEFMLGDNILVAPILKVGQTRRMVYLPEGKWVHYDNHMVYNGNQYIIVEAKLDECPIFVKYNSIIPTYSNTNIENPNEVVFECYGDKGEYKHYQDNGLDFNYENGEYNIYKVSFDDDKSNVELVYNGYNKYNSIKVNIVK